MMILLTGGAACGKSAYGEELCLQAPLPRYYLAAMRPFGEEGRRRVQRHRRLRTGKGFQTIERYTDYAALRLPAGCTALLECVGNLTANEMFDSNGQWRDPTEPVLNGVEALRQQCGLLVVVTNEVGSDGYPYPAGTAAYIEALGRINALLAARADRVVELVAGIPLTVKGVLTL